MTVHRRPKILSQTAGHVAGAAYYYRNVVNKSMFGVSVHPKLVTVVAGVTLIMFAS